MRLKVDHTTVYRYAEPPRRIIQLLRLTPPSFVGQSIMDWRVDVNCDARLRESRDGYGNLTHMLYVEQPTQRLAITVSGLVLTQNQHGVVRGLANDLPAEVFLRSTPLTQPGAELFRRAAELIGGEQATLDRLHGLNRAIYQHMRFDPEATSAETRAEDAFAAGHGVCQDFAHIFIAIARIWGVPARYVSGHLFRSDGDRIQDAAHAWAEAWLDDLGWVAFDPANGLCADDAYVRVACGLDYRDASPIAGARLGGGTEELDVEVQVSGHAEAQVQS
jgi:transglutaminase-like putative cysteine protease